ncbi:helix-turn-helix domain-containing protein [Psychrobacillus antarcticus]|uniref:helix-turn-helix domain-containing protein n=1 Tax=Psychrobacillus antarcticus TaxID=2879115 RepID=UPI0024084DFF|nr:helix-turn-helix domain-containing protein [Psychrobacillus antarcticus]
MTELGARLKEARTAKGYSIEDLQEITKIQKRYLAGIEEGNYATMPGAFYVRAFIKQYAEAVGLNGDELLETYKTEIPSPSNDEVTKNIPATPSRRALGGSSNSKLMEIFPMIMVVVFVIAIIVMFWFLFQNRADDPEETVTSDELTQENKPTFEDNENIQSGDEVKPIEEEPVEEEVVEEPIPTQELSFVDLQGVTSTYNLSNAENYLVKLVAVNTTWLNIRDENDKILVDQSITAGETFEFDASAFSKIRVRLGHAPGNIITINDEVIEFKSTEVTQNAVIQFNK